MAITYILQCADGTLYTGWTSDLEKRLRTHQSGKGAKYTRARLPVALVYAEEHPTQGAAMSREAAIKSMKRHQKLELIAQYYHTPKPTVCQEKIL